jgi:hypothetical protein
VPKSCQNLEYFHRETRKLTAPTKSILAMNTSKNQTDTNSLVGCCLQVASHCCPKLRIDRVVVCALTKLPSDEDIVFIRSRLRTRNRGHLGRAANRARAPVLPIQLLDRSSTRSAGIPSKSIDATA